MRYLPELRVFPVPLKDRQEYYRALYRTLKPGWKPSTEVYQEIVASYLGPGVRVLDLGCGRGGIMERLHPRTALTVGVDYDWASLREHRAPAIFRIQARAEILPFLSGSFDLVICSWVLEHLAEPEKTFREIARVLKPGGHFIFLTPNLLNPIPRFGREVARAGLFLQRALVASLYGRQSQDVFYPYYRANTPSKIEEEASKVGLKKVSLLVIEDPTYLAFNRLSFRASVLIERFIPPGRKVHLVGVYKK
ncbi:MAG: class I SAM-dependent methyltransferase [Anaerolineae bacterium]|nr:class I SAM-dependent methyltransferase [Anaerolineae bacterium]MDW8102620.1 class I SAM-dependent methyltransferase [Anaerolineae bacterium]